MTPHQIIRSNRKTLSLSINESSDLIIRAPNRVSDDEFQKFISENGIEIAGIEYIVDQKGEIYTYDVNTNTNYNSLAEKDSKIRGMKSIAEFLKKELLLLSNIKVVA